MGDGITLGAIGIVLGVLAMVFAGFVYMNQTTPVDLTELQTSINANKLSIASNSQSVSVLDQSDQTLLDKILEISRRDNNYYDKDVKNLENDVNDVEEDIYDMIDCLESFSYSEGNNTKDWNDLKECLDKI